MCRLVPFMEPDKAARAAALCERSVAQSPADVVPGIRPSALAALIPRGRPGRSGRGTSMKQFSYLRDSRTQHVSRRTIERLVPLIGDRMPPWTLTVIDENWRFSPLVSVQVNRYV
jgi:hypothetical protein